MHMLVVIILVCFHAIYSFIVNLIGFIYIYIANCDGDAYPVTSYILHPQWNGNVGAGYDVAVIFLSSPITTPGAMEIQIRMTIYCIYNILSVLDGYIIL